MVAAGEGQPIAAQQRSDDLQRLFEPGDTVVGREAEGQVIRVIPASAQAQGETTTADAVGGDRHLRQQRRAAKRHAHHKLAQRKRVHLPPGGQPARSIRRPDRRTAIPS